MLICSRWQWNRYKYKVQLVDTFKLHSSVEPIKLPISDSNNTEFKSLLHQKVSVSGQYDYEHQMIVLNRKHKSGPGYWLLTPLRINGSNQSVIISRGFIPFSDREKKDWEKYNEKKDTVNLLGVLQPTTAHRTFLAPKAALEDINGEQKEWTEKWRYPDIEEIAKQFPYPLVDKIFIQRIAEKNPDSFPAQSISINVPPSTHFGYTFEWIILTFITLMFGFVSQAYPNFIFRKGRTTEKN